MFCHDKHVTKDVFCCNKSMLVTAKLSLNVCRNKCVFVVTSLLWLWQIHVCWDKTCLLSLQKYSCHNRTFLTTNTCLLRQVFVATKVLLWQKLCLWQFPPMAVVVSGGFYVLSSHFTVYSALLSAHCGCKLDAQTKYVLLLVSVVFNVAVFLAPVRLCSYLALLTYVHTIDDSTPVSQSRHTLRFQPIACRGIIRRPRVLRTRPEMVWQAFVHVVRWRCSTWQKRNQENTKNPAALPFWPLCEFSLTKTRQWQVFQARGREYFCIRLHHLFGSLARLPKRGRAYVALWSITALTLFFRLSTFDLFAYNVKKISVRKLHFLSCGNALDLFVAYIWPFSKPQFNGIIRGHKHLTLPLFFRYI